MKNQALFSSKAKSKEFKCHLLQFLFGTLRVKQTDLLLRTHIEKLMLAYIPYST